MVARHTSITLRGHRKEDRELIFTMETDSFLSNSEMKAHCEAVWHKFNTLTNNNPQIWPCLQLYAGCALLPAATENFRLGRCFGPAYLLDLLHYPKCTGSSLSLNAPIY